MRYYFETQGLDTLTLNNSSSRLVLQSLLDKTQEGETTLSEVREHLVITDEAFHGILSELTERDLVDWEGENLVASFTQRIELSVLSIRLGADFEKISKSLGWKEFEELVARVFRENGFDTKSRYRFHAEGRRWEIDVLATSYPYIVCAECKHYTSGIGNRAARRFIEIHIEKTRVMSEHIEEYAEKIDVDRWGDAYLIPITVTLSPTKMNIYRRVPSVSVFMLPSFLSQFPGYMKRMTYYPVEIPKVKPKPTQLKLR